MKRVLLIVGVVFLLASCQDNQENTFPVESTNQNGTRLVRLVSHNDDYPNAIYTMRYYYWGNRLYKFTGKDNNSANDLTLIYTYSGSRIAKIESFNYNNSKMRETLFTYNDAGDLIHETKDELAKTEFSYTMGSSNILTRQAYFVDEANETHYGNKERFGFANNEVVNRWREVDNIDRDSVHETITYDAHHSPMKDVLGYDKVIYFHPWRDFFYFGNQQNVLTSSSVFYYNGNQSTQNLVYAYTYNSYGFPMSCRLQYVSDDTGEIVDLPYRMEYYYE